jgi:cytochrome c oxidase accessory protein FixG
MPDDGGLHERVVSAKAQKQASPLYANRVKVYPRRVSGRYRAIKWALLIGCLAIYYLLPFLRWDRGPNLPDQAVLIDLAGRKAYFFWIEIWPQEVYFLTGLLILAAFTLFLVTSLLGRVWCGYACPQTVWTDLFMLVERLIEGDRNARMKLDAQPLSVNKALRKTAKHSAWLVIAVLTGGAWIMYFGNAPTVLAEVFSGNAGVSTYFFIGLFTSTTYILAGWAREQVCTYMCPWPRFQAAMLDEHSLVVTYRAWRGEKRGSHKKGQSWEGRGDCIDCNGCVAVCPTGIDIRDGQQLECIGCGLCIDACNAVMDKVERPRGLIAFDTYARLQDDAAGRPTRYRLVRPRTLLYGALVAAVGIVMLAALAGRSTIELSVQRDRAPLFVMLSDGGVQNAYTLRVSNKTGAERVYRLAVTGVSAVQLQIVGEEPGGSRLTVGPDQVATFRVLLRAPQANLRGDNTPVVFTLAADDGAHTAQDSVFLSPPRR